MDWLGTDTTLTETGLWDPGVHFLVAQDTSSCLDPSSCLPKEVHISCVYLQIDRSTADRSQDTYETRRSNHRLFGEPRTKMAGEVCFFCEYVCDDGGWGNYMYLIAVL